MASPVYFADSRKINETRDNKCGRQEPLDFILMNVWDEKMIISRVTDDTLNLLQFEVEVV